MPEIAKGEPAVVFDDVHLGFEDHEVLRGVSFKIAARETKVLLGESGSGKTLILKLAAGLIRPDSGRILVMGQDLSQKSEVELLDFRRKIGFVFQEGALFDSLDVNDNVAFRLREEHVPDEEVETRVHEALRFVEMEQAIDKFPDELSGGMRRRVSIARALVDRPPIVFYDSPTAGLDPLGVTSVLATHRLQDAFGLANFRFDEKANRVEKLPQNGARGDGAPTNVLVLKDGEIYYQDSADNLLKSTDKYLKQFLASAE
jgi:phospholipid/cholesterol/gamma-HCH transport system ATP-binding protein